MRRALGGILGAMTGLAFTTMGLIHTRYGVEVSGGNEATPTVIGAGIALGAVLGLSLLWRWPLTMVGATMGLLAGIWMRDNASMGPVQPPWVFFLLFGLPALGAGAGYLWHRRSEPV